MKPETDNDPSNGYEANASEFMAIRRDVGLETVRKWAQSLSPGASILDLGCGHGVPISPALMNDGFEVHGIDASPSLTAAFRERFPRANVACEAVEDSRFFDRTFDGVIAIGLVFLLPAETQRDFIPRVASALKPGGRFLFTAPTQIGTWPDLLTGQQSFALGAEAYRTILSNADLALIGEYVDEGENHYYDAQLRSHTATGH